MADHRKGFGTYSCRSAGRSRKGPPPSALTRAKSSDGAAHLSPQETGGMSPEDVQSVAPLMPPEQSKFESSVSTVRAQNSSDSPSNYPKKVAPDTPRFGSHWRQIGESPMSDSNFYWLHKYTLVYSENTTVYPARLYASLCQFPCALEHLLRLAVGDRQVPMHDILSRR